MTAVSNLPACDPNKVPAKAVDSPPVTDEAGKPVKATDVTPVKADVPAAKVAEPSAPNVEAKTEPATAIAQPR